MPTDMLRPVVEHLRTVAHVPDADVSDGQLLACFAAGGDENGFAALLRRHGPMVWAVCRSTLGHAQDAEDAFQATYLALAQKAASLSASASVGGWLYRVASRTAGRVRAANARRRSRE